MWEIHKVHMRTFFLYKNWVLASQNVVKKNYGGSRMAGRLKSILCSNGLSPLPQRSGFAQKSGKRGTTFGTTTFAACVVTFQQHLLWYMAAVSFSFFFWRKNQPLCLVHCQSLWCYSHMTSCSFARVTNFVSLQCEQHSTLLSTCLCFLGGKHIAVSLFWVIFISQRQLCWFFRSGWQSLIDTFIFNPCFSARHL